MGAWLFTGDGPWNSSHRIGGCFLHLMAHSAGGVPRQLAGFGPCGEFGVRFGVGFKWGLVFRIYLLSRVELILAQCWFRLFFVGMTNGSRVGKLISSSF